MKRHYYHITDQEWKDEITLHPKSDGEHRPPNEPDTPRTCVGPTPWHCLIATGQLHDCDTLYIYCTKYPIEAQKPEEVMDSHITKEMWILKSTQFVQISSISADLVFSLLPRYVGFPRHFTSQRRSLPKVRRAIQKHFGYHYKWNK